MPAYVRGNRGRIVHVAPRFSFPDNAAHGKTFRKEPTFHVAFTLAELWGDQDSGKDTVVVDVWESYLQELA
jgi:nitrile hydratase